jgi:hypothetical protein
MSNPWKVLTIGLVAVFVTALTSGLTTAYLLRASNHGASETDGPPSLNATNVHPSTPALEEPRPAPIVHVAKAEPAVRRVSTDAASPSAQPSARESVSPDTAVTAPTTPAPSPSTVASAPASPAAARSDTTVTAPTKTAATTPSECASGGDRAMNIAKPGALGGLLGAGLGAVGGAIANGGKGAGKGALIGGLTGVAAGSAYGAYKTKQECGTIFGSGNTDAQRVSNTGSSATPVARPTQSTEASFTSSNPSSVPSSTNAEGMQIYNAR